MRRSSADRLPLRAGLVTVPLLHAPNLPVALHLALAFRADSLRLEIVVSAGHRRVAAWHRRRRGDPGPAPFALAIHRRPCCGEAATYASFVDRDRFVRVAGQEQVAGEDEDVIPGRVDRPEVVLANA